MNAANSGVMPEARFTYSNLLQFGPTATVSGKHRVPGGTGPLATGIPPAVLNFTLWSQCAGFCHQFSGAGEENQRRKRAFWEMGAYNTREGHVVMISAAFTL